MLHPIEQASVTLAGELRHDRITELHVLVAWLQQDESPIFEGKDTIRVNGHILLRELLSTGMVERATSNRISLLTGDVFGSTERWNILETQMR